jgi:hypothetical protein
MSVSSKAMGAMSSQVVWLGGLQRLARARDSRAVHAKVHSVAHLGRSDKRKQHDVLHIRELFSQTTAKAALLMSFILLQMH